jgi:hypothetical protein
MHPAGPRGAAHLAEARGDGVKLRPRRGRGRARACQVEQRRHRAARRDGRAAAGVEERVRAEALLAAEQAAVRGRRSCGHRGRAGGAAHGQAVGERSRAAEPLRSGGRHAREVAARAHRLAAEVGQLCVKRGRVAAAGAGPAADRRLELRRRAEALRVGEGQQRAAVGARPRQARRAGRPAGRRTLLLVVVVCRPRPQPRTPQPRTPQPRTCIARWLGLAVPDSGTSRSRSSASRLPSWPWSQRPSMPWSCTGTGSGVGQRE